MLVPEITRTRLIYYDILFWILEFFIIVTANLNLAQVWNQLDKILLQAQIPLFLGSFSFALIALDKEDIKTNEKVGFAE